MNENRTNDHLANERTFLAWVRTSIAVMGFGFVVVKFSIFLTQIKMMLDTEIRWQSGRQSETIGMFLIAAGALLTLMAYLTYIRTKRQIITGGYAGSNPLILFAVIATLITSAFLIDYVLSTI
ncbi:MAG: YidH family protein [Sphingobacterium sp.]|uniref:YidH family protein n=1 Tax=Sphingobacterium sp. JB170 TaxID=1434842 RepID=UPI00097F5D1B|nr:DUF202 domain-containing protein [Sphingobacterium sp. JB170]SJN48802.1 hypothetical protein FM107_17680 [Sphingobacterium sp. JB170]